ncbi:MAG: Uma2 family endonuclease [Bryobacteraceae bacterium]
MSRLNVVLEPRGWLTHSLTGQHLSREEYLELVAANPELRMERSAAGEVTIMPPAFSRTGNQNAALLRQVAVWADADGNGEVFDSSTGFDLPNGSNRSPDVSWVLLSRLDRLTLEERGSYLPLCPDFVAEIRSKSDRLAPLQNKMREYLEDGARLCWLVDPIEKKVHIFRPATAVEVLTEPIRVVGDPELPGLVVDFTRIWHPRF